jgi:carboxypeptidase C (cathepsin A)
MRSYKSVFLSFLLIATIPIHASEGTEKPKTEKEQKTDNEQKKEIKEEVVVTTHVVNIDDVEISYKTSVGTQILKNEQGASKASIFYIAYTKENVENKITRPVTFCFNGGPGSSSVWLHLGIFGPKRVNINDDGLSVDLPYHLVDNPSSILDVTDLVFIDPVSTGYSRAAPGEDAKQFHGVDEDVQSVAEFIRLYTTRN